MIPIYELTLVASEDEVADSVPEVTEVQVNPDDSTPLQILARKVSDIDGAEASYIWLTMEQAILIRDFLIFALPK